MLGKGTSTDPYQITSRADLESIVNDYSASYKLMNDIDLSNAEWIPFPQRDANNSYFTGTLDGNGKVIRNMKIRTPVDVSTRSGLFENVTTGSKFIKLGLVDIDIQTYNRYVGGIAGYTFDTHAEECYVTGKIEVIGNHTQIGGLFANARGATTVRNCYTMVDITVNGSDAVGGFIGYINGSSVKMSECFSFGNIYNTSSWSDVGGFYGSYNEKSPAYLVRCYFDFERAGTTQYALNGVDRLTTAEIKSHTYSSFVRDEFWEKVQGEYPTLKAFAPTSLIEAREVLSYVSDFKSKLMLDKIATYKSVSSINKFSASTQRAVKSFRTGTAFIKDIVSGVSRSVQVVKVGNETVDSYILPITSNVETLKRQIKLMTLTVNSHVQPISGEAYRQIKSLREALSFIDLIVGKAVTPYLKPEQVEAIVYHVENGTLSQYLSNQNSTNVIESQTLVEVID